MKTLEAPAKPGGPARKTLWAVQDKGGEGQPFVFVLAGYGDAWARELAAVYVEQLRAVQPRGPYCLGGYSAGAVMALEMAIQLRAQGEVVGLVALLDPLFIRYTRFEHLSYHALQGVCRAVEKIDALAGYKPDHYPGDIVFYQARWSLGRSPLLVRQWKWFTRARVNVETVPGDHHTFIRPPHVKELARRLRSELGKTRASGAQ